MITPPKIKSHLEQLLSKIYARRPRENNKRVCIDCLKPRSNKNKFKCKICGCTEVLCSIIKTLRLKYCPVCNV